MQCIWRLPSLPTSIFFSSFLNGSCSIISIGFPHGDSLYKCNGLITFSPTEPESCGSRCSLDTREQSIQSINCFLSLCTFDWFRFSKSSTKYFLINVWNFQTLFTGHDAYVVDRSQLSLTPFTTGIRSGHSVGLRASGGDFHPVFIRTHGLRC